MDDCTVHMNAMLYKVLYACLYINTYIHTYKQINPSVDAKKLLDLVRRKLEGMYVLLCCGIIFLEISRSSIY
jgi:hypothetical protein